MKTETKIELKELPQHIKDMYGIKEISSGNFVALDTHGISQPCRVYVEQYSLHVNFADCDGTQKTIVSNIPRLWVSYGQ